MWGRMSLPQEIADQPELAYLHRSRICPIRTWEYPKGPDSVDGKPRSIEAALGGLD